MKSYTLNSINKKDLVLFTCSLILLLISQLTNIHHAAPERYFKRGIAYNSDGYVIGKIAVAEQEGLFKNITALSQVQPSKVLNEYEKKIYFQSFFTKYSREAFLNKTPIKKHNYYLSKTALHCFFYSLGNKVFSPNPFTYLKFILFQKVFLFSLVLSFLVLSIRKSTNLFAALLLLIGLVFSPIVILSARCLWYAPFTWYLPFLTAFYFLFRDYKGRKVYSYKHCVIIASVFLFHMLFHTFEFITSHLVTAGMPFVFFGILKGDLKQFISRSIMLVVSLVIAVFISLFLLLLQYKVAKNTTFPQAIEYVQNKYKVRTSSARDNAKALQHMDPEALTPQQRNVVAASKITRLGLINNLMNAPALAWYSKNNPVFGITYKAYFFIISISSFLLLIFTKIGVFKNMRMASALFFSTWISILGPFSWWIIFKDHSFFHQHLVVYLWFLPYLIFGFMLIGHTLEQALLFNKRRTLNGSFS